MEYSSTLFTSIYSQDIRILKVSRPRAGKDTEKGKDEGDKCTKEREYRNESHLDVLFYSWQLIQKIRSKLRCVKDHVSGVEGFCTEVVGITQQL